NTLTLAGTDGTTMTFPGASDTVAGLGTAQTWTANQTVNADFILGNNKNLKGTLSGGGTVNLLQLDTTNTFYIGNSTLPNDVVFTPGSTKSIDFVNAAGTLYIAKYNDSGAKVSFGCANTDGKWTFYDAAPTTGDSYMCIRDGAARGSRIAFGNNAGTYDVAICHAQAGALTINNSGTDFTQYRDLIARDFYTNNSSFMARGKVSFVSGAGAATGTLTNAPTAGNPTKWIPIDDNGTTRYIPAW
ncbi:MAG TPA: hypothetical protein VE986_10210, partial [Hyphomicrobiales bacterium]|nr:hypothetical protein [Hyphomicrobiales bacterium]